jgi:hypothetical protein
MTSDITDELSLFPPNLKKGNIIMSNELIYSSQYLNHFKRSHRARIANSNRKVKIHVTHEKTVALAQGQSVRNDGLRIATVEIGRRVCCVCFMPLDTETNTIALIDINP